MISKAEPSPGQGVSRRSFVATASAGVALAALGQSSRAASRGGGPHYRAFHPGALWLDTSGKPIQVHGGSVISVGDDFYWYGENKEFTTGKTDVWTWGVRCYRSRDLYNWDDLGLIIPPDTRDRSSPLHPSARVDRPHILYNQRTKTFVCWIKLFSDNIQTRVVLVADAITGPYRLVAQGIRPLGMSAGDFDLVQSPDDGKAYMYFERVHSELVCADLTDDYTGFTGYYSTHFPRPGPPSVREGPAYFRRGAKHYLATSGTTGYFPNPSEIAIADTFHGPFQTLGDLHPGDVTRTSFNSQISCIFRHPGKADLYIAMADRWMPDLSGSDFSSGKLSRDVQSAFGKYFANPAQNLSPAEEKVMDTAGAINIDTSRSRYVWLPIRCQGDRPSIEWADSWSIDEFE